MVGKSGCFDTSAYGGLLNNRVVSIRALSRRSRTETPDYLCLIIPVSFFVSTYRWYTARLFRYARFARYSTTVLCSGAVVSVLFVFGEKLNDRFIFRRSFRYAALLNDRGGRALSNPPKADVPKRPLFVFYYSNLFFR